MSTEEHFRRVYRSCSASEIRDLVEAIRSDKYWSGLSGRRDVIYVVALTRAQIRVARGFLARVTYLGRITVLDKAAPFCRRGRVLAAVKEGSDYTARSVIPWPIFLRIMHGLQKEVYYQVKAGRIPPFVNRRILQNIIDVQNLKG